jgi:hypothetical protein
LVLGLWMMLAAIISIAPNVNFGLAVLWVLMGVVTIATVVCVSATLLVWKDGGWSCWKAFQWTNRFNDEYGRNRHAMPAYMVLAYGSFVPCWIGTAWLIHANREGYFLMDEKAIALAILSMFASIFVGAALWIAICIPVRIAAAYGAIPTKLCLVCMYV